MGRGLARCQLCTGTGTHVAGGACAMAMNAAEMATEAVRRETGSGEGELLATGAGEWGEAGATR